MTRLLAALVAALCYTAATGADVAATVAPAPGSGTGTGRTVVEPSVPFGPGDFDLPDPSVGLESLPGFVATLSVAFDGARNGEPERWVHLTTLGVRADPPARTLTIARIGVDAGTVERVLVDGARFERVDNGTCTVETAAATAVHHVDADDPVAALPGVIGAEEVGAEPVAGVPSTHYVFDERALGSLDPASVDGHIWVADDSGVVMRFTMVVDGSAAYLGVGVEGRLALAYEVSAIGGPDAIDVPARCPPGHITLAEPPGAADVLAVPGLTTLTAPGPPAEVREFYAAELAAAGWAATDSITAGEATWETYTLDRAELTVQTAPADGGGTAVTLVLLHLDAA